MVKILKGVHALIIFLSLIFLVIGEGKSFLTPISFNFFLYIYIYIYKSKNYFLKFIKKVMYVVYNMVKYITFSINLKK
jgi:hypothetical protein